MLADRTLLADTGSIRRQSSFSFAAAADPRVEDAWHRQGVSPPVRERPVFPSLCGAFGSGLAGHPGDLGASKSSLNLMLDRGCSLAGDMGIIRL